MKILTIKEGKGYYINPYTKNIDEKKYELIEKIEKEDILAIIRYSLDNVIEMTECDDENNPIHNPAQKIVYQCIYDKLANLNVDGIKGEVNSMFEDAEKNYNTTNDIDDVR